MFGLPPASAQVPSFTLVGHAGDSGSSRVYGLSADGRSAAGYTGVSSTNDPGFLWTRGAGRYDFGLEAGLPATTFALGISGDGFTAVGSSGASPSETQTAFRWSGPGTFQSLGTLNGFTQSRATGVNTDGSIVTGFATNSGGFTRAFRWTTGVGMQPIGPDTTTSQANAISRDGTTIVGEIDVHTGSPDAFRWTSAGGWQALASLNGSTTSYARGVSADGSYIVGLTATSTTRGVATVWHNGVPTELTTPSGWLGANPLAVSDNGQVVVGAYDILGPGGAAIWTPNTGFLALDSYLTSFGITLPEGVWLENCVAISADGMTFAGTTYGPAGIVQGYVATIPTPGVLPVVSLASLLLARGRRAR